MAQMISRVGRAVTGHRQSVASSLIQKQERYFSNTDTKWAAISVINPNRTTLCG